MPGIFGIIGDSCKGNDIVNIMVSMAFPLIYNDKQNVTTIINNWYATGVVDYDNITNLKQPAFAEDDEAIVVMEGELFPDNGDIPQELNHSKAQRAKYCLAQYKLYGAKFINKLNGTFALAIIEKRTKSIQLYTDRICSRALYYSCTSESLIFSDNLRAIITNQGNQSYCYDPDSIVELMMFERVLGNKTLFKNIFRIPPGSVLTYVNGGLNINQYWSANNHAQKFKQSWEEASDEFLTLMKRSIEKRISGEENKLVLISGGIDSRLLLSCCNNKNLLTGTFTNQGQKNSQETEVASKISRLLKYRHVNFQRQEDHYSKVADLAVDVGEGMISFASFHSLGLHKDIEKEGVKAVLTAQWWDTFLKGYYSEKQSSFEKYDNEPTLLRNRRIARNISDSSVIRRIVHQDLMMLLFNEEMQKKAAVIKENIINSIQNNCFQYANEADIYQNITINNLFCRADWGLQKGLRTEFFDRSPILDNDIIDFALRTPEYYKKDGRLIRRALLKTNKRIAFIIDVNTGIPAFICPPYNRIILNVKKQSKNAIKAIINKYRSMYGCTYKKSNSEIFKNNYSWHNINSLLKKNKTYQEKIYSSINKLSDTIFDKQRIKILYENDIMSEKPRLYKLFEAVLTFQLFDDKWGPGNAKIKNINNQITIIR